MRRDAFTSLKDVRNIRLAIFIQRCGNTNNYRLNVFDRGEVSRSRKLPFLHQFLDGRSVDMLNVAFALINRLDLGPVNIQPDHEHSAPRKLQTKWQTHITQSDNGYSHVSSCW